MNDAIRILGLIFEMLKQILNTSLPYDVTLLDIILALVSIELGFKVISKFFNIGIGVYAKSDLVSNEKWKNKDVSEKKG